MPLALNLSALTQASAQSTGSGYKALVCIFLAGGNDAFNTVLATDTDSWSAYTHHRLTSDGSAYIALPAAGVAPDPSAPRSSPNFLGGVLPISHAGRAVHAGRQFALHPALVKTQQMYQAGRVGIIANIGPLTRPTTKSDYTDAAASKPVKLFSHNDQQSTWQTFHPEGTGQGWGGLMGDALMGGNAINRNATDADLIQHLLTCMSPGTGGPWLAGAQVLPYQSSLSAILGLGNASGIYGSLALQSAVATMMGKLDENGETPVSSESLFAQDHQAVVRRALQANALLSSKLGTQGMAPWGTAPADGSTYSAGSDALLQYTSPADGTLKTNNLALQLQMVARLIDLNRTASLGMTRQFFMVNLGSFDTHDDQIANHAERLAQLDHALDYFDKVLSAMPSLGDARSQVTTFTASDFGRTFTSNGDGTDHGWGAHHFVMGGSVIGTEVYGTFPTYSAADAEGNFSSADQIQNGILIPTTSVDHLAYTLGRWMGVAASLLVKSDGSGILPNLQAFPSSGHDLGCLRA